MDPKSEKIALFRYGLIAPLVLEVLPRGELSRRAREIASRQYDIPYSNALPLCRYAFALGCAVSSGQFRGPGPQPDKTAASPCDYSADCRLDRTPQARKPSPHRHHAASGTRPFFRGRTLSVSASTLYRFLKQRGLTGANSSPPRRTKFEAQFGNQIAVRHAFRSLRATTRRWEDAGIPSRRPR
jgi:hypothetical protein